MTTAELPKIIEGKGDLCERIRSDLASFKDDILKHGGVLFRGFDVKAPPDFQKVIEAMDTGPCVDYIGGDSPRNKVHGGIYTSTEAPPSFKIPLHNELSFVKNYPSHIYFFCQVEPEHQGTTPIADARKIYDTVDPEVKKHFVDKGLKYVSRYFHRSKLMDLVNKFGKGHKTWIDVFETEDKSLVEEQCRKNDFDFRWLKKDWIEVSQNRPSVMPHPKTNEMIWFNQAHLYDFNPRLLGLGRYIGAKMIYSKKNILHEVFYGDGTKIPRDHFYHILDVLDQNTVEFPWRQGDVLVLDNVLTMHGRSPFKGKRRILTAMTR